MNIEIIVGANYGDEGKGQTTYDMCGRYSRPVVVMTNGGCQRGHTVEFPGFRHVFHHFGSGTPRNVPTYFPDTYFVNPMEFVREFNELAAAGYKPIAYYSPTCTMQFPADMMVNRVLETHRAVHNAKHGSCGWGIYETVVRNKTMPVLVEEFAKLDRDGQIACVREIAEYQLNHRIRSLHRNPAFNEIIDVFTSDGMAEHFVDDFDFMYRNSRIMHMDDLFFGGDYDVAVFENAQGLLLDESFSHDPDHSTPSMTGLNGVCECINRTCSKDFRLFEYVEHATVNYVSRTYLTRHGAGPFREYDPTMSFPDKTNIRNDWQDGIRFGRFDARSCSEFEARTCIDFMKNASKLGAQTISKKVLFTHLDELPIPDEFRHLST